MKNLFLLLGIAFLASCSQNKTVTVNGTITNAKDNAIVLKVPFTDTKNNLTVAEDGSFTGTVSLEEAHTILFSNGTFQLELFAEPGSAITINMDADDLKKFNSVEITGTGSEASNLILSCNKADAEVNLKALLTLPPSEFEQKMNDDAQVKDALISAFEANHPNAKKFIDLMNLNQSVNMAQKYDYYLLYHARFAPNDTSAIPESYSSFSEKVPVNNYDALKESQSYKSYVVGKEMSKITTSITDADIQPYTLAYTNKLFDGIAATQAPQEVKDDMVNQFIAQYTSLPDSIQQIMKSRYAESMTNAEYLDTFKKLLEKLEKLTPGAVAPSFAYSDSEGNEVSSEDLKGKVIYIDVWATWCGPCKGEIPYLKAMEEELHKEDIAFVSISIDEDKEAWVNMVAEKELKGYQLHAPGAGEADIIKDYAIRGIPRFIMIDKEGKIVNSNATRPSNPETKAKLLELAKS